jgi:hypothetical protein
MENSMNRAWTAAMVVAIVAAPIGFADFSITQNDAAAVATLRPGMVMPGKTRTFGSGGEFRVCNEGSQPLRMFAANNLTNVSTDSLLAPGQCARAIGTMMSFKNEGPEPVMTYSYGGLGGRPGRGPGHVK